MCHVMCDSGSHDEAGQVVSCVSRWQYLHAQSHRMLTSLMDSVSVACAGMARLRARQEIIVAKYATTHDVE